MVIWKNILLLLILLGAIGAAVTSGQDLAAGVSQGIKTYLIRDSIVLIVSLGVIMYIGLAPVRALLR